VDLTIEDVAYILGVTRATIYNRQAGGSLPSGTGIDLARAAIRIEEDRIAEMRRRLTEKITEHLVVG